MSVAFPQRGCHRACTFTVRAPIETTFRLDVILLRLLTLIFHSYRHPGPRLPAALTQLSPAGCHAISDTAGSGGHEEFRKDVGE
jgi:hypothetical protein